MIADGPSHFPGTLPPAPPHFEPSDRIARDAGTARELLDRILRDGHRLTPIETLSLITHAETEDLFEAANRVRERLHPEGIVTYVVDRNINYSNVCTSVCAFCAFYRKPGDPEGYVHSTDEILEKVRETIALGGSGCLMQGGLHPELPLEWYTDLLRAIGEAYPDFYLHCFSPTEIHGLTQVTDRPAEEILLALKDAGLRSIPGGGGEILVDAIRRRRRSSCSADEWLEISATAHRAGIPTTATMMIGLGEELWMRAEHLDRVRRVQDETRGFISFIPWTFQPDNTPLGRAIPERVSVDEYLRWHALCRLVLDNVPNQQVSWLTNGLEAGIIGLRSGANDIGSTMIEENVISVAGADHQATEEMLRSTIVEAGFRPGLRNGGYHRLEDRPIPHLARTMEAQEVDEG
jgi:cyclic dehypoxanthinyl futalosine synthase